VFARRYNGPAFAQNRYHEKLAEAHSRLSSGGLPDLDVRAVQLLLTYHGSTPARSMVSPARARGRRSPHSLPSTSFRHRPKITGICKLCCENGCHRCRITGTRSLPPPRHPLRLPDLRVVQSLLAFLGRDPGPVDGKPGPRARTAVMEFQRSLGVVPTGEADAGCSLH
jgi:hypothetical protein